MSDVRFEITDVKCQMSNLRFQSQMPMNEPACDDPLETPVQFVRGVGPRKAELLAKLDIFRVSDLLWHLPRDVLDLTDVRQPNELVEKVEQTVRGTVVDIDARQVAGGRTLTAALIDCGGEYVRACGSISRG